MRTVIQRVTHASVTVNGETVGAIGNGLLVLLGVEPGDTADDLKWRCNKTAHLRIFDDDAGVMNLSVIDTGGDLLVVSQFTLLASTRKGNRPSYIRAAAPAISEPLYEEFCSEMERLLGKPVKRGVFGADMKVELLNSGPVTIIIDSKIRECLL